MHTLRVQDVCAPAKTKQIDFQKVKDNLTKLLSDYIDLEINGNIVNTVAPLLYNTQKSW